MILVEVSWEGALQVDGEWSIRSTNVASLLSSPNNRGSIIKLRRPKESECVLRGDNERKGTNVLVDR